MELKLFNLVNGSDAAMLLIVPYGIETGEVSQGRRILFSFNCTLWN